jgi:hypothetical protein
MVGMFKSCLRNYSTVGHLKVKRSIVAPYNNKERLLIKDPEKVRDKLQHF